MVLLKAVKSLYQNQDLTKVSEANFHEIRGKKIGMIFQDPLSSLNPTMKIGKQITEAMLVNGNRMKNRLKDLYHIEYHNYLNMKKAIEIEKENVRNAVINLRFSDTLTRAEKQAKIKELKTNAAKNIGQLKKQLPDLKAKYLEAKKRADKQVKQERSD